MNAKRTIEFKDPRFPAWRAHSSGMKILLGMRIEDRLPAGGTAKIKLSGAVHVGGKPTGEIVGVRVWVAPLKSGRKVHRVRAECAFCCAEMSAGRLFQHSCQA